MQQVNPPNWYIALTAPPVTIRAGRGVFVPGRSKRFLVESASLTERHFSIHWVMLMPQYRGEITIDEYSFRVRPGVFVVAPPHSTITLRFEGRAVQYFAHVSLPCGREPGTLIPCVTALRRHRTTVEKLFATGVVAFARDDARTANGIFGRILELIVTLEPARNLTKQDLPLTLHHALNLIEAGLHRPIYVGELAAEAGVSRRQLLNQFRQFLHTTIAGFVRQRRIERALLLLRRTRIPVKSVAAEVGVQNLQLFNKLVRRAVGIGPRSYRSHSHGNGNAETDEVARLAPRGNAKAGWRPAVARSLSRTLDVRAPASSF